MLFKKVFALLTIVALLCVPAVSYASAYTDIESNPYAEDIEELSQLGIIRGYEGGLFRPNLPLTRAEFCQLTSKIIQMDGYVNGQVFFSDVPADHWANGAVSALTSCGYINGYEDGTFRPDETIDLNEALTILVRILGYQYKAERAGGYPTGYYVTANELEMLKGLQLAGETRLKRDSSARLFNNVLDIPLVDLTGIVGNQDNYTIDKDVTLLSKYMKMKRSKGIVTASEFANVNNMALVGENQIMINGITLSYTDPNVRNFVGYKVRFTYKDEEEEVKELVAIQKEKNIEYTIASEDFISFADNKVSYIENEEDDKEKKLSISDKADVIYNGESINFDKNMFKNVKYGTFTFVSNDNDNIYDVVIINEYNTQLYVGNIDKDKYIVKDQYNTTVSAEFDPNDRAVFFYEGGKKADFSNIKLGSLLLIQDNTNVVEVFISNNGVAGVIEGLEDEEYVTVAGNTYQANVNAIEKVKTLKTSASVKLTLDYNGKIGLITTASSSDVSPMYLIAIDKKSENLEDEISGKFFTTNGETMIYPFADNLQIDGASMKKASFIEISNTLKSGGSRTEGLVLVKFNSKGEVRSIELPKAIDSFDSDEDGFCISAPKAERQYWSNPACFDFEIYVTAGMTVMTVPENAGRAEEDEFYLSSGFSNLSTHKIAAYSYSKDDIEPAVIVKTVPNRASSGSLTSASIPAKTPLSVVISSTKAINDKGEVVTRVRYMNDGTEKYADLEDGCTMSGNSTYYFSDLSKGDTITIQTDAFTNRVRGFQVYYKYDTSTALPKNPGIFGQSDRIEIQTTKSTDSKYFVLTNGTTDQKYLKNSTSDVVLVKNDGKSISIGNMNDISEGDIVAIQMVSQLIESVVIYKQ